MGVQSLLKSCLQILSMCRCNLVWVSCLELSAVEYTQKVQTAKQQGQLQAVICSSAQQLAKGGCQKGNSFSHLPPLCQSLGEAADSSVRYGQTSSQSFTFPFSPFCLPMAKMCWSQAQNFAFRTWRVQLLVAATSHVRYQKNPLLNVIFCLQCISFLFLLFQAFFSFLIYFWFWQCLLKITLKFSFVFYHSSMI